MRRRSRQEETRLIAPKFTSLQLDELGQVLHVRSRVRRSVSEPFSAALLAHKVRSCQSQERSERVAHKGTEFVVGQDQILIDEV